MKTQDTETRSQKSEAGAMNIEFKDTVARVDKTEDLFVRGENIGRIVTYADRNAVPFHAVINVARGPVGIIQGFGDTKIAAIKAALTTGREEAEAQLRSIAELEAKLFSSGEAAA